MTTLVCFSLYFFPVSVNQSSVTFSLALSLSLPFLSSLPFPLPFSDSLLYFYMTWHGPTLYDLSTEGLPSPKVSYLSLISNDRVGLVIGHLMNLLLLEPWWKLLFGQWWDLVWTEGGKKGEEIRKGFCQPERPRAAYLWAEQDKWSL